MQFSFTKGIANFSRSKSYSLVGIQQRNKLKGCSKDIYTSIQSITSIAFEEKWNLCNSQALKFCFCCTYLYYCSKVIINDFVLLPILDNNDIKHSWNVFIIFFSSIAFMKTIYLYSWKRFSLWWDDYQQFKEFKKYPFHFFIDSRNMCFGIKQSLFLRFHHPLLISCFYGDKITSINLILIFLKRKTSPEI